MHTIIQFSPTGNVAHLALMLQNILGEGTSLHALEHTNPQGLQQDDHLIVVFAIHAFNAPRTVKRFISALPAGIYKRVSLIAVGCNTGWINKAATKDLKIELKEKSYEINVDRVVAMPLTFIMAFPDDVAREQIVEAEKEIAVIAEEIRRNVTSHSVIPMKSHIINFVGRGESGAARLFGLELHANDQCTHCGLCWRECPEKNITCIEGGKIQFGFQCLMCMRCIYNCPEKAISPRISKFIPISKGYSIKDYID